jgi:hypothetical protein
MVTKSYATKEDGIMKNCGGKEVRMIATAACIMALLGSLAVADTVTSVNVVGVFNVNVAAGTENALTFVGVPMTKLPVERGKVLSNTASTITANGVAWDVNAFAPGGGAATENGVSTYYVEITSGLFEGRHFYIASNTADTLTLAGTTDLASGDLDGHNFKIIPANRIRDIFGEPGSADVKLTGGGSSAVADSIRVWVNDPAPGSWSSPVFYLIDPRNPANNGWVIDGTPASDMVVDRDVGVLVKTLGGVSREDILIQVLGEVSANNQSIMLEQGAALLGGMVAVDTPIGEAGLEPPVLKGGGSSAQADSLFFWDNGTWSAPIFYLIDPRNPSNNGWVQNGAPVSTTFILKAGQAYYFKVGADTDGKCWERVSPLK